MSRQFGLDPARLLGLSAYSVLLVPVGAHGNCGRNRNATWAHGLQPAGLLLEPLPPSMYEKSMPK